MPDPSHPLSPELLALVDEAFGEWAAHPDVRVGAQRLAQRLQRTASGQSAHPVTQAESALTGRVGRYTFLEELGSGGMGIVMRVHDHQLNRKVALKVLRPDRARFEGLCARFLEEAQTTAQLEHPGVIPVYDFGSLPDGRAYYTMQEVRGEHLANVIVGVHARASPSAFDDEGAVSFRRLVDGFRLACEAVAYAHARGVVHRDIKPENILMGEFGEVYVVDWGLARLLGTAERFDAVTVQLHETEGAELRRDQTRIGSAVGTPGFMSPEQAAGHHAETGTRADVFSLGVVLFQLLTNQRCDHAEPHAICAAQEGVLRTHPHHRRVPPVLRRICLKATAPLPEDRYADAHELARALARWLEGAERRARALELVEKADAVRPEVARMRHKQSQLRALSAQWLARVPPERPVAEKRRAWAWEREADTMAVSIERTELHYVELLTSALQQVPNLSEARTRLARFYREAHARAEQAGDRREAARMEAGLYAFDDGTHADWLRGDGALTLRTEPAEAEARLYRYEEHDRRLVPVPCSLPGPMPMAEQPLSMGSYLLVLEAPGRHPVRYPVWLSRCHHWSGLPPESESAQPVVLPRLGSIERGHCVVPAGWCVVGDSARRSGALAPARVWVDSFVMQRFPVTNAEYLTFLEDLVSLGEERRALELAPRPSARQGERRGVVFERSPSGGFESVAGADPLGPVVMIPHTGAEAYAAWYAQRTGLAWRLPGELEWEKAARGVDGRRYPWGDAFDPTHANCRETRPLAPELALNDTHPVDVSPYGVRGLGGNVRDWCADVFLRDGPPMLRERSSVAVARNRESIRVVRGGSWAHNGAEGATAWARESLPADARAPWLGFRLVRSLPDSPA